MKRYERVKDTLELNTLISFAEWNIQPNDYTISHLMERLHMTLYNNGKATVSSTSSENILGLLAEQFDRSNQICEKRQSTQQFVYSLYSDIALTELKGFTLMEFSLMVLRMHNKADYIQEAELMRSDYIRRTAESINILRYVMQSADRTVYRCDPEKHTPNVTYDELTRLLQGYVENEVDMHSSGSCFSSCDAFDYTQNRGCYYGFCHRQTRCSGDVRNCRYMGYRSTVCQASSSSNRRYEYIEYDNGSLLGQYSNCGGGSSRAESWRRWIFWKCHYCFCLCDEKSLKSDRFFNLRGTLSDIKENKVVTGLRFVKKSRVFHLQIQQGVLLPLGIINETTVKWRPVNSYGIYDSNVTNGVDYHTMDYWRRSIDLDDVKLTNATNFVVTGLRFQVVNSNLNLMAHFTKFDFKTGQLLQNSSVWHFYDSGNRQRLNVDNSDLPTRLIQKSTPLSKRNQYLQFVNSGIYQDAAQTTVPFIDIQDVVPSTPVPLAGIGIYYKSRLGYGGFVAPKIMTYDYSPHVQMPNQVPSFNL